MGWIVGDSFGGIQQAQTAEDSQNRAAFANSMSNLMAGLRERNNQRLAKQQLDLQKAYQQAQMTHAASELDLQRQHNQWQHELGVEHNRLSGEYNDLSRDALKANNATEVRQHDFEATQASNQADRGLFGEAEDVPYPWMSDPQKKVLVQQSLDARQQREAAYKSASGLAGLLNKHKELTDLRDSAKKTIDSTPWYRSAPTNVQKQLDDATRQLSEITPRVNRITQDPRLSSLAYLDPDQDKYVPAVPAPSWIRQSGKAAPAPAGRTRTATQPQSEDDVDGGVPVGAEGQVPSRPWSGSSGAPAPAPAQVMAPAPAASMGSGGKRKYPDSVYDQVNYFLGQGMTPPEALRQALAGDNALFGKQPAPLP